MVGWGDYRKEVGMGFYALVSDDMVKVEPRTGCVMETGAPVDDECGRSIEVVCGRNEYVGLQVHVHDAGKGKIDVEVSDFRGEKARISAAEVTPFLEYYFDCGDAWVPDALVPFDAPGLDAVAFASDNGVPSQKWRSVWLDVFIPPDTPPGEYSGTVTVRAAGKKTAVDVVLKVLSFRIPDETSILSIMNNYVDCISGGFQALRDMPLKERYRSSLYRRVEKGVYRMAHEHRMVFDAIPYTHAGFSPPTFTPELEGEGKHIRVRSWRDFDRHFGGYFDGSAFKGTKRGEIPVPRFWLPLHFDWPASFLKWRQKGYRTEFIRIGREIVDHFKEKGWTRTSFDLFLNHKQRYKFFQCDAEEMRFINERGELDYYNGLWSEVYRKVKGVKFAFTYGVTWTYHLDVYSHLVDYIDVWVSAARPPVWLRERTQELRRMGKEVWYTSGTPSMKESTVSKAWWPLNTWMLQLDGHLPWMSVNWTPSSWRPEGHAPGALNLMYPGEPFGIEGPIASMRMKIERSAMQLVERMELAARKVGRDVARRYVAKCLGRKVSDWYAPKPSYLFKKPPWEWTNADWATAGSAEASHGTTSVTQWRRMRDRLAEYVVRKKRS